LFVLSTTYIPQMRVPFTIFFAIFINFLPPQTPNRGAKLEFLKLREEINSIVEGWSTRLAALPFEVITERRNSRNRTGHRPLLDARCRQCGSFRIGFGGNCIQQNRAYLILLARMGKNGNLVPPAQLRRPF